MGDELSVAWSNRTTSREKYSDLDAIDTDEEDEAPISEANSGALVWLSTYSPVYYLGNQAEVVTPDQKTDGATVAGEGNEEKEGEKVAESSVAPSNPGIMPFVFLADS